MTLKCCKHITLVSAMLLSLSLLAGCGGSNAVVPDEPELPVEVKESFVNLDLRISVNNGNVPASRVFDHGQDGDFEAPASEYEKVRTLRVVIVRPDGMIEHNRMVSVRDSYPDVITSTDIINDNLTFKVVADETKKIYLFANESAVNRNKNPEDQFDFTGALKPGVPFPTDAVSNIMISRKANEAFIDNGPRKEKTFVPMSEFFDVKVPAASNKDPEKYITETLFITRSLIKFSFWAAIASGTGDQGNIQDTNLTLAGVEISNLADQGYYLPNGTVYMPEKYTESERTDGGRIIEKFNVPSSDVSDCSFIFPTPMPISVTGATRSPMIYLPETKTEGEYMVRLLFSDPTQDDLYASQPLVLKDIPRNTHVKVNMTIGKAGALLVDVEVLPWNREDYYIDYTANVGFNDRDYLQIEGTAGQTGDYLSLNTTDAQLVLNYGKVAKGSFFIASPVDATWDAFLVTTGGEQDAIQFQIPDPEDNTKTITTTHISGVVGKDRADFGIVATVPPGSVRNSANLIVIVTLANGTPVVANIIGNWPDCKEDRLTVIENPQ